MRKLKSILILLLTILFIACGALLPTIIAGLMDRDTENLSGSRDMVPIALELGAERKILPPAGKIDLLRRGKCINITEKDAAMTEADVNAAVESAMAQYIDAGIFDWFDYSAWTAVPKLCIDPDVPDNYSIIWTVTVIQETKPYQTLAVDVDDETGKIYSIRYDIYGEYSLDGIWERSRAVMDTLIHVYLDQLGLFQENAEPYIEYSELDGEVLCGRFFLRDAQYGEVGIEFYVTGTGSFWVYFP